MAEPDQVCPGKETTWPAGGKPDKESQDKGAKHSGSTDFQVCTEVNKAISAHRVFGKKDNI